MSGTSAPDPFGLVGALLERKYRVDRVVARGGFGIVYRGHHLALDTPVAIKVLSPSRDLDAESWGDLLLRFLDEAKTLAKLRHPSVVTVLDAAVTYLDTVPHGVPWMALEWLDGVTLRDDLRARRGMGGRTPAECLELLRPVLEGIAYAHDAGIVHRDLTPNNVMLVPSGRGVTARVLDFGIAKIIDPETATAVPSGQTDTDSRVSSFTTGFAAPEQLSGARTGPWTDIFALGLLLTEMLIDAAALPTDDSNEHYRAVFSVDRPTPRAHGVDVGAWEEILARALAVRPAERPPNARALLGELETALPRAKHEVLVRHSVPPKGDSGARATSGDRTASGDSAPWIAKGAGPRRRSARNAALGVAIAAVAAGGVLATRFASRRAVDIAPKADARGAVVASAASSGAAPVAPRAVRVATLLAAQGDGAWASPLFAEMIGAHLIEARGVAVADRDIVAIAAREHGDDPAPAEERADRLRKATASDVVLVGSARAEGANVRLEGTVRDAARSEPMVTTASIAELCAAAGAVAARLTPRGAEASGEEPCLPYAHGPDALRAYAEGLASIDANDLASALPHFERAVAIDGHFALAHQALAAALFTLGFTKEARRSATRAFEEATALPQRARLLVEATYRETRQEMAQAASIYDMLHARSPDDPLAALAQATSHARARETAAADAAFALLADSPDPRAPLARAESAYRKNDWTAVAANARRAIERAHAMGLDTYAGEAQILLAHALVAGVDRASADDAVNDACATFRRLRDERRLAAALDVAGSVAQKAGNFRGAKGRYEEALALARRHKDRREGALVTFALGQTLHKMDDHEASLSFSRAALREFLDFEDKEHAGWANNTIGNALSSLGRLDEAKVAYREASRLARDVGADEDAALALINIGIILRHEGNPREARAQAEAALASFTAIGSQYGQGIALNLMAESSSQLGELDRAADEARRAILALSTNTVDAAEVRTTLADVLHAQKDLEGAEREYRAAIDVLKAHDKTRSAAHHSIALANLLAERGKVDDAWDEAQSALATLTGLSDTTGAVLAHVPMLHVFAARGDRAGASAQVAILEAGLPKLDVETRAMVAEEMVAALERLGDTAGANRFRARDAGAHR